MDLGLPQAPTPTLDRTAREREPVLFEQARDDTHDDRPGEDEPPVIPPRPVTPPQIPPDPPGPIKPPSRGTLIPDWREGPRGDLTTLVDDPEDADPITDEPDDAPEEEDEEEGPADAPDTGADAPTPSTPLRRLAADWRKGFRDGLTKGEDPAGDDQPDGDDKPGEGEDGEAAQDDEPRARRAYRRPAYREQPFRPRQSGMQWWAGLQNKQRHGTYFVTAFAAGTVIGLPQFVSRQAVYLVATYQGFTPNHVVWGALAGSAVWLAWRTRHMWPPVAWAGLIPLVSLGTGLALYGPPVGPLDDFRSFALSLI